MRVATWNLERKRPTTPTGAAGVAHLTSLDAEILVLTESRVSFPAGDGHLVASRSWGDTDERKVVMWSARPWTAVDDVGATDLPPGRFVAATTETSIGAVRVVGVCIAWHMANVRFGERNKRPWEDHLTYCRVLERLLATERDSPLIVAGDYNQRLPSPRPTRAEAVALASSLASVEVLTAGVVEGCDRPGIDHIAVRGLDATSVWGWPSVVGGVRCSDHGGVAADLALAAT